MNTKITGDSVVDMKGAQALLVALNAIHPGLMDKAFLKTMKSALSNPKLDDAARWGVGEKQARDAVNISQDLESNIPALRLALLGIMADQMDTSKSISDNHNALCLTAATLIGLLGSIVAMVELNEVFELGDKMLDETTNVDKRDPRIIAVGRLFALAQAKEILMMKSDELPRIFGMAFGDVVKTYAAGVKVEHGE